jgi:prepilin-type N-terminal cleavage/methylation domain-containing protein
MTTADRSARDAHRRAARTGRPADVARPRFGYTLLELAVTLAIVVVLASLTWPALLGYMGERTIREEAHRVRIEAAGARIKAIDNGLTYQFRYEPGGRWFVVLPYDRPDVGSGTAAAASGAAATPAPSAPIVSGELPERCRFEFPLETNPAHGGQQPITTERLPEEWLALVPEGALLQQASWSPAIRFFPDGTADDATLAIIDEEGRKAEIWVRGLTGTVEAGQVRMEAGL